MKDPISRYNYMYTPEKPRWKRSVKLFALAVVLSLCGLFVATANQAPAIAPTDLGVKSAAATSAPAPVVERASAVTVLPVKSRVDLPAARKIPQTFNNCGPATTSMVLQYFGHNVSQAEIKARIRTNADDRNVFTYEIADYLKSGYGINSKLLYNGDLAKMKLLLSNGVYIVVEDLLHPGEDIGHFTIIRGYDDAEGVFYADDSFIPDKVVKYKYVEFDQGQWKPFNREYLPVYLPDKEPVVKTIVGEDWDEAKMYQRAIKVNQQDIDRNPSDMSAWFNLGTSYYALGDHAKAKEAFDKSRALGWPRRMLWYQIQPVQNANALGNYSEALELAKHGLSGNDTFSELHYESAVAYKGLGNSGAARSELDKALQYYPSYQKATDLKATL